MIYTVICDGENLHIPSFDCQLTSGNVELEINSANSFNFVMPPNHIHYDVPDKLISDVEVWEEDELIFFGRVLDIEYDFSNNKRVTCEGPMAYLNDSIQRPDKQENINGEDWLAYLLTNHNNQCPANRQINVGQVSDIFRNKRFTREVSYDKTIDALRNTLLNVEGGYLFFRKESNGIYVDWLDEVPSLSGQVLQFAVNLKDMKRTESGAKIRTAVIPLGDDTGNGRLTIKTVNSNIDYLANDLESEFGLIPEVVTFDGVTDAQTLKDYGQKWLNDKKFNELVFEVSAAELSYINSDFSAFKVGQMIHVTSAPHNVIDKTFPLTKMSYDINSPEKKITIGTPEEQTLTDITASTGSGGSTGASYNSTTDYTSTSTVERMIDGHTYNLPIASDTTLGGIKVGSNLSIDQNGILSAVVPTVDHTIVDISQSDYDALTTAQKCDLSKVYMVFPFTLEKYYLINDNVAISGMEKYENTSGAVTITTMDNYIRMTTNGYVNGAYGAKVDVTNYRYAVLDLLSCEDQHAEFNISSTLTYTSIWSIYSSSSPSRYVVDISGYTGQYYIYISSGGYSYFNIKAMYLTNVLD